MKKKTKGYISIEKANPLFATKDIIIIKERNIDDAALSTKDFKKHFRKISNMAKELDMLIKDLDKDLGL